MNINKIIIYDMCDAFNIHVVYNDGSFDEHYFDQEDDKSGLVDVFTKLGFTREYEEMY